jgi:hypothetical protein
MTRFLLFELSSSVENLYFQAVNFKQLHRIVLAIDDNMLKKPTKDL